MIQSAYDTTTEKIQIFLAVSAEDFPIYQAKLTLPESDRVGVLMVEMPEATTGYKWNRLAQLAFGQPNTFYMLAADDMVFKTNGWDKALVEHYAGLERKQHIYALRDSRDPATGTPHPIFTREWISLFGWMVNPMYLHWFVDTHAVEVAKSCNVFTHFSNYELTHIKPSDHGNPDETHSRIRSWGWAERDRFVWEVTKEYRELDKQKLKKALHEA
jgi:hypothetical protein